jgi:hypothetical protein
MAIWPSLYLGFDFIQALFILLNFTYFKIENTLICLYTGCLILQPINFSEAALPRFPTPAYIMFFIFPL